MSPLLLTVAARLFRLNSLGFGKGSVCVVLNTAIREPPPPPLEILRPLGYVRPVLSVACDAVRAVGYDPTL